MGAIITRLFRRFNRKSIELEVEEELRFHVELLMREHTQQGMSPEQAREAILKRFGDIARIKNECVEISRRSHPLMRALRSFLILIFLTGILVRVFGPEFYIRHVGDMLIAVAVLSHLLLYARGLKRPPKFNNGS
ncbi:MAG TPA: permease prefix domain 1-containing protein [Blastocatellia bacterium]|nr:permease prefix domain 1-containing protein [Blastocatellia bacterium]